MTTPTTLIEPSSEPPLNFALQSKSPPSAPLTDPVVIPWSGGEWVAYFRRNAAARRTIPWEVGVNFTEEEHHAVVRSLQAWQLGETSEGNHLRAAAVRYATAIGDPEYADAVDWFIREEQFHGESLGRVLDLAGAGRRTRDWGDGLFRAARYLLTDIEVWTTPVIMVETMATVYYNAVRRATRSPVLAAVCRQILADEVPHLRFQAERLAALHRRRGPLARHLTCVVNHLFFALIVLLVWLGHRRPLRAGGYSWRRYWRASWDRMRWVWKQCDPARYAWGAIRRS